MLGAGEHYALEVKGDSMIVVGIFDGDYVVVRRQNHANDGTIVAALISLGLLWQLWRMRPGR